LLYELAPGISSGVDDVPVGVDDAIGEPVLAQKAVRRPRRTSALAEALTLSRQIGCKQQRGLEAALSL
jgi:hypothetical protein